MIYLILDVFYNDIGGECTAKVSGIRFHGIEQTEILSEYIVKVENVAPYESGQFYKRELPCLLAMLDKINDPYDFIIIDGYVFLDGVSKPGLGKYLYDSLAVKKPIIGIAKNHFHDISEDYAVWRGISKHPLYVTSVGMEVDETKHLVANLAGKHRMPTMVTAVDQLGRN